MPGPHVQWRTCRCRAATVDQRICVTVEAHPAPIPSLEDLGRTQYPRLLALDAVDRHLVALDEDHHDKVAGNHGVDDLTTSVAAMEQARHRLLALRQRGSTPCFPAPWTEDGHTGVLLGIEPLPGANCAVDPSLTTPIKSRQELIDLTLTGHRHRLPCPAPGTRTTLPGPRTGRFRQLCPFVWSQGEARVDSSPAVLRRRHGDPAVLLTARQMLPRPCGCLFE